MLVKLSAPDVRDAGVRVPGVLALEWDVARKVKGTGVEVERVRREGAASGAWILMEFVEGKTVKELLRAVDGYVRTRAGRGDGVGEKEMGRIEEGVKALLRRIGRAVGALHSRGGVVHGDLTSSNVMVRPYGRGDGLVNGNGVHEREHEQRGDDDGCPDLRGDIVLIDFGLATQSTQDEDRAVDLYVLERAFGSTHPRQEGWFDAEVLQHQDGYKGSFKGSNVVLKRLEEVRMRGRKRSMVG